MVRAKRAKIHRSTAKIMLTQWGLRSTLNTALPLTVTLTRIATRNLDDDNLQSGCKAARDGVADWLGLDDADKRITWLYAQAKGKAKEYGLMVEIA